MAKTPKILNFEVVSNESTRFCVQLNKKIRLCGQRHANRYSGSFVWELWLEQYAVWKTKTCMGTFEQETRYGRVKANAFRGVLLAKSWSKTKAEIFDLINTIPAQPLKIS